MTNRSCIPSEAETKGLKMIAGDPPNALLVVGLSFNNIDKFEAMPNDTYIRIKEPKLPIDVVLASGDSSICGKGLDGTREIFVIQLSMDDLKRFRRSGSTSWILINPHTACQ